MNTGTVPSSDPSDQKSSGPAEGRSPRAQDAKARRQAQQRADRIGVFREELAELEREQALELTPEQRSRLDAHLERLLGHLATHYDVDVTASGKRIAWGMRLASLLGGAALCAALVLFLHRIWGLLPAAGHVLILTAAPILALALAEWAHRRGVGLYYTALLALAACAAFVLELSALGSIFNLVPSPHALLAWGGFVLLVAYAYGLRLPLAAGLVLLAAYLAALLATVSGGVWMGFPERPESLLPGAAILYAVPEVARRRERAEFDFVYRLCGAGVGFLAILILALSGHASWLGLAPRTAETLYQFAGLVLSAGVVAHGLRLGRSGLVNAGAGAFVVFLYVKLHAWWWHWLPKYLFFLLISLTAVGLLYLFRRVRARLLEGGVP